MKKTEKYLLAGVSLLLVLLFLLSSTDLVLKERKNEVYVISILIDDDSSKNWDNFRMGMEKASEKWNVDASFVTLYDKGSVSQQKQLLEREVENGADAILLSPADSEAMAEAVDGVPAGIPVIAIGAEVASSRVRSVVAAEPETMGAELGAKIAVDHKMKSFSQVIEVTYRPGRSDTVGLEKGLFRALPDNLTTRQETVRSTDELDALVAELALTRTPTALVALDAATLLALAEATEPLTQSNLTLYGVGWSSALLRYAENEKIAAVGVYSDYDLGYLSVEAAVNSLRGEAVQPRYRVGQALIPTWQIHSKAYEMMLFPIS